MVKIRRLVKQTFQRVSEISFSGKMFDTYIVFVVSIIQLLSRKGARYGFNVPKRYVKT